MTPNAPSEVVRQASTWSILWGVSLIVLGMLAVGSPFLAAIAVNVVIAWLIVLAGVVHVIVAFHSHRAGSLIWRLLVGIAYVCFGAYLIARPALGVASLTLVLDGEARDVRFQGRGRKRQHRQEREIAHDQSAGAAEVGVNLRSRRERLAGIEHGPDRWHHHSAARRDDLCAMAIERFLGDRHIGRREHDHQRRYTRDAVTCSPQDRGHALSSVIEIGGLSASTPGSCSHIVGKNIFL